MEEIGEQSTGHEKVNQTKVVCNQSVCKCVWCVGKHVAVQEPWEVRGSKRNRKPKSQRRVTCGQAWCPAQQKAAQRCVCAW